MRIAQKILCMALLFLLCCGPLFAQRDKKSKRGATTEQTLVNRLEGCLSRKDAYCYLDLWPDMDTFSKIVMEYADSSSAEFREMQQLQYDPVRLMHLDSFMRANLTASFDSIIAEGEAQGIHWASIVPVRYELVKMRQTRHALTEKLAPTRFVGYLFFTDVATRRSFGLMVGDMMQIKGEWYGGRMRELYEATTREEWEDARYIAKKQKKAPADSTAKGENIPAQDDDREKVDRTNMQSIAERKLYIGMFDNEIPVQLYVRSLKGGCPTGVCSWEAIYKFGDQDDYIRLLVTRTEGGGWQMTETPPAGVMDLELKGGIFTGTWTSPDGQTGYDVKLSEKPVSAKKVQRLDGIFAELKGQK